MDLIAIVRRVRNELRELVRSPFRSQVGQDRWVVETLRGKRGGYFVELGAADGVSHSNTYGLEKALGWSGVCIEANPKDFAKLQRNRSCATVNTLVSSSRGRRLTFTVNGELSGVNETAGGMMRSGGEVLTLETTTLRELLEDQRAPRVIDYLSLDVEGHELEVLKGLLPGPFALRCITVEHNEPHQGPALRMALREFLVAHGYRFVKGNDDVHGWGHGPIDDFYVIDDAALAERVADA